MSDTPTPRRVKLRRFRLRQDFCVDSYSVDHPPPVKSFEGGIPYCALGYVVDGRWLDRYAHEHGLVKEDGTTLHRDSPMNEAIFYLLDKTKERDIMCKRIGDGMVRLIWYAGNNKSEETLKRATDPERISRLQGILGIDEPPTWICPTKYFFFELLPSQLITLMPHASNCKRMVSERLDSFHLVRIWKTRIALQLPGYVVDTLRLSD
ncbi:hypothetical protein C8Q75DRAFT_736208 [Abortiporus biennis]|nr:hypothetical protein C8Q75DRAFT_736208 [Abortiporus biennis]